MFVSWPPFTSKAQRVGILLTIFTTAAWAALPRVSSEQAAKAAERWPGVTLEQLEDGRTLYVNKCAGCHNLRLPESRSAEAWPSILDRMQIKAKLTDDQKTHILQYILTVRK
jgi:hypothetical protein